MSEPLQAIDLMMLDMENIERKFGAGLVIDVEVNTWWTIRTLCTHGTYLGVSVHNADPSRAFNMLYERFYAAHQHLLKEGNERSNFSTDSDGPTPDPGRNPADGKGDGVAGQDDAVPQPGTGLDA